MSQSFSSFPSDILSKDEQADILDDCEVKDLFNLCHDFDARYLHEDIKDVDSICNQDLHQNHVNTILPPISQNILSNEEYPGPLDFEVCIHPNGTKNPWVFSPILKKVYMDLSNPFPIDFKIKNRPDFALYVRATPTFSLPQHSQDLVCRCISHEHPTNPLNKNIPENVLPHVIRCNNPSAMYTGNKEHNERLSVLLPLAEPQTGTESTREMFVFVCKNSCLNPGMNRRPIEVIFTLESALGVILGRRVLMVRICSCPKRDKEKEEKEYTDKSNNVPRGKKRKLPKPEKKIMPAEADVKNYALNVSIPGKHNLLHILKCIHDAMAGEIVKRPQNGSDMPFRKCLNDINVLLNKPVD